MRKLHKCSVCAKKVWLDDENPIHCAQRARRIQGRLSQHDAEAHSSRIELNLGAGTTIKTLNSQYKSAAKSSLRQLAYGQHLSCSGDRYGMFYALSLFKDSAVAFFCSAEKTSVDKMLAFTEFYASGLEGLDCVGYKIIPVLTQGEATDAKTNTFKKLKDKLERQEKTWFQARDAHAARGTQLRLKRTQHLESRRESMDAEQLKSFERKQESIETQIVDHENKFAAARNSYESTEGELRGFYQDTRLAQEGFADELEQKLYHTPFVWTDSTAYTWRGGNQLYSDASEPNNISKSTDVSTAARLIQPHPDLRVITIGKSHMHLSKLLERVGGCKFAAATKYIGTTFLRELDPRAAENIKVNAGLWSNQIVDAHRRAHPASTATLKLLLVWVRGLNGPERSGVQGLKKRSAWDAEESVHQFSPFNHSTIHDAKKNPHHVMNVQIFEQLSDLCRDLSGKHTRVIPIAIGDPLLTDMYDPLSPPYIDKENRSHLIEYWTRAAAGVLTGTAGMLKQRTFLLELWRKFEIVQIGVRSGMLEFLAYNGLPTIYLEREVDCDDPDSGAPRIKQLAYELEELYSPGISLPKLPWFRMKHRVNVGLSQYKKATIYNPKILTGKKITGTSESEMLGYFDPMEMKTLKLGIQNIFQSPWVKKVRAVRPERAQYSMKDVESGEFGLLDDRYGV